MVRHSLRFILASLSLASVTFAVPAPSQPLIDPVQQRALTIRDRFISAMKVCGDRPGIVPGVVVKTDASMVSYMPRDHALYVSRWSELDPQIQGLVAAWAAQGTLGLKPDQMFGEIFNDLLVAHELGHYLQDSSGRLQKLDSWDSEVEANRIAIAFFQLKQKDRTLLPKRIENFTRFLTTLPNPVPSGETPHAYFVKNYEKLGGDPQAYGWYQGAFMQTAWASRGERDFCGWVKLNPPSPKPKRSR